ncbi:MAG: hypothetical protein IKF62_22815, partial [Bosea sp.]|nr:hypothetical protein [Bosea sp. (in: a-proteobacteria)]
MTKANLLLATTLLAGWISLPAVSAFAQTEPPANEQAEESQSEPAPRAPAARPAPARPAPR